MNALRWHAAISHLAVILWQLYLSLLAWRSGVGLGKLLHGLGAQTGPGVTLFVVTCRWWFIVPVIFCFLGAAAIRRLEAKPMFSVGVLAAEAIVALALNIWWREAWYGPLLSLMGRVGQ